MRYYSASVVRIITLFSLVVLSSHSFVGANAEDTVSPSPGITSSSPAISPTASSALASSSPLSSTSSVAPPSSSTPGTSPSSNPSSQSASLPSASSSPASSATSVASTPTSTSPPTSSGSSSGSSAPVSSSSAPSLSSSSSFGVSTHGTTALTVPGSAAASVPPAATQSVSYNYVPQSSLPSPTVSSTSTNTADAASSTPKSFLENKGAAAATFTIIAIVAVAIIAYVVLKVVRRRSRLRHEEDDVFFEKYNDPEPPLNTSGPNDSSYDIATTAAHASAYPDRSMHYGTAGGAAAFENPDQYGMEYPPGTAYAAAQTGSQYQYSGQAGGYDPTTGYAAPSTGPGHPFADPGNVSRAGMAPPVGKNYGTSQPYYGASDTEYPYVQEYLCFSLLPGTSILILSITGMLPTRCPL
ncbi:hypothetical protein PHLCEN_2v4611 [Hermanssonia centrifuga]|uniref:Uncharacterized protein n=1 Tax=Hermanssonia centrifuga TaxID=98765 RepID=A0A2R6PMT2_9APHY|nr:hypothetical protein PHLCEN_2v4611 [Hermanssonia centrifuga]